MKRFLAPALLRLTLALALAAAPAAATWSVVIVNRATGEVALGQATCIVGPDLQAQLAVVVPGVGGACVQAWWDFNGQRRELIWNELQAGTAPRRIVALLNALPNPQIYQFGIADLDQAATFTGSSAQDWAGGVSGTVGDISYAIQGNVLAGEAVVRNAELALLSEPGDTAKKLMAAMLAAAQTGGDGRCSCSSSDPDSCGAPPPGFDLRTAKSAHTAFVLVSRVGDAPGTCGSGSGCANGEYYMDFRTLGHTGLPDPIVELRLEVLAWRAAQIGRPDHIQSRKRALPGVVPGDGQTSSALRIALRDIQGRPLLHGGAAIDVRHAPGSAGLATFGGVQDHGDGTYSVRLTAGAGVGTDAFEVVADDGAGAVLLYPYPTLVHAEPTAMSGGGTRPAPERFRRRLADLAPAAAAPFADGQRCAGGLRAIGLLAFRPGRPPAQEEGGTLCGASSPRAGSEAETPPLLGVTSGAGDAMIGSCPSSESARPPADCARRTD